MHMWGGMGGDGRNVVINEEKRMEEEKKWKKKKKITKKTRKKNVGEREDKENEEINVGVVLEKEEKGKRRGEGK